MNHILLTGASGFIGKQVLSVLEKRGHKVRVISRNNEFNETKNIQLVVTKNFFTETYDWYRKVCQEIDVVIHLAWYVEPGLYLDSEKNIECLIGTINFANAIKDLKIRKFIGVGTCLEYDLKEKYLTTDTKIIPQSLYAASKASCNYMLRNIFGNSGIEFTWARLFNLYGEGEDGRRLFQYIKNRIEKNEIAYLSCGKKIRDYQHVGQAAVDICNLLERDISPAVNICSGIGVSIETIAKKIANEYGKPDLLNFSCKANIDCDEDIIVGIKSA